MRKQDNPVFVLGVLVVVVLLILAGWLFLPWFQDSSNAPKEIHLTVKQDSLPCFLVISDIHLQPNLLQANIPNRDANTGRDLWDSTQNKIKSVLSGAASYSKPKFMIVLGDVAMHTGKLTTNADLEAAHANSGTALHDLRTMAETAHVPLIYVSGNNDPWDGDYHPFSTKIFGQDTGGKTCWPLITTIQDDSAFGQAQIIDTSKLPLGIYSAYPLGKKGGLRVILLNSTMFVQAYTNQSNQQAEVTDQMAWFEAQLAQASDAKEAVLIAMHVPLGWDSYARKDFWSDKLTYNGTTLQNAFLDLLEKNQAGIIGVLTSHTHMDGVRRLYGKGKKLVAVDISVPGISPGHRNNPGIKLISYNPGNFSLQNFRTLYENYFPTEKVQSWGTDQFDFRSEFGCPYGTSIRQYLQKLDISTLQGAVQSIYKVKNGQGGAGEVNPALDVDYK